MTPHDRVTAHSNAFLYNLHGYAEYDKLAYITHMLKLCELDDMPIEAQIRTVVEAFIADPAPIVGEQIKRAMIAKDIVTVPHHACALCGYWVKYIREGDRLFFNASCRCGGEPIHEVGFKDAAEWINTQTNRKTRNDLMALFGLA